MDDKRFDALTRSFAAGASRRRILKGMIGGLVGGVALGGASRAYAEDEDPLVTDPPATDPPATDPPATDPPATDPPATDPPATDPPATDPPATDPPATDPPATDPPATDPPPADPPPTDPPPKTGDDGTPADPAAAPAVLECDYIGGQIACDSPCCDTAAGWICCGVYCMPPGSCCSDAECEVCDLCGTDGRCFPICESLGLECCADESDGSFICAECCSKDPSCNVHVDCDFCKDQGTLCCIDDKHQLTCAECCGDSDCWDGYGACSTCYGGYCLSCFDQTDGAAPVCAPYDCEVSLSGGDAGHCVQCCDDWQCEGACEYCHNGWCKSGCSEGQHCCSRAEDDDLSVDGGYCAECCGDEDCEGDCQSCYEGHCRYDCGRGQICCHDNYGGTYCGDGFEGCCGIQGDWCEVVKAAGGQLSGACCDGLTCCYNHETHSHSCAECCGHDDCEGDWHCCGGVCSECCEDDDCKYGVCNGGYCVECASNDDCVKGSICCDGRCTDDYECCYANQDDPVNCGECETCVEGWCKPTGVELYGACFPMEVYAGWDVTTPQLNCCNGLVCCDTNKYGLVCLECCADADCADGCYCHDGFCSCPCWSDNDCADGTCCCKNGSCSADCCEVPPPPPPKPPKPESSGTVTTLPATGSGGATQGSSWFGAAAIGAAAAFWASRKLRPEETPETQAPEE